MDFTNQTAIATGAASGMGLCFSENFTALGGNVVMCAVNDRSLSSAVGFRGICRKILIFLLVGIANILDTNVIGTGSILRTAAIFFYLSNEGVSLLENAAHLGLPVPGAIKEVLEQLHERAEHGGNDDEQSK